MAVGANPSDHFQQLVVIARQIAPVYRLVMRDPVPKEVETLDTILHVSPDLLRVIGRWVLSETRGKGGHPTAKLSTASCTGTSRTRIRVRRLPCRATRADLAWLRVGEHRKCQLWPGTSVDLERDALAGTRDSATLGPSRV